MFLAVLSHEYHNADLAVYEWSIDIGRPGGAAFDRLVAGCRCQGDVKVMFKIQSYSLRQISFYLYLP